MLDLIKCQNMVKLNIDGVFKYFQHVLRQLVWRLPNHIWSGVQDVGTLISDYVNTKLNLNYLITYNMYGYLVQGHTMCRVIFHSEISVGTAVLKLFFLKLSTHKCVCMI